MAAVGWLLAAVRRRRASLATRPSGGHSTLRRWHLALAAAVGYKLLRAGLAALWRVLASGTVRNERRRLQAKMQQAGAYE